MTNNDKSKNNDIKGNKDNIDSSKKKKLKKQPSKVKRFFKNLFLTILALGIIGSGVGLGYVYSAIQDSPPLDIDIIKNLNEPSMLYGNDNNLIDIFHTQEERYIIDRDEIPDHLVNAYIAIEDERFIEHPGIDVRRILGAALHDVQVILGGEGYLHGASTLTQQLLKNTLLYSEASTESGILDSVNRKIKEIYLALQLEKQMNKEEIVTAYLNTIPLGGYIYGVESASYYYFGKSAIDLTLPESAYIAGLAQAPTTYSAFNTGATNYPNTYINRTVDVLMKMHELGFITDEEYAEADAFVVDNQFTFNHVQIEYGMEYEWFMAPALDQVRDDLMEKYKYTEAEVENLLANGGLEIHTTLDVEVQDTVQSILNDRNNFDVDWWRNPDDTLGDDGVPKLQSAATIINHQTGEVVAIVGGRGDQPPDSINHAYDDLKHIASSTKPITVYAPAIDTKTITAATPFDDAPVSTSILNRLGFTNGLKNYGGTFSGYVTARDAIAKSINIPTVLATDKIGLETAVEYGEKAGLVYNDVSRHSIATLALGQFDNDTNDRDGGNTTILASAYGSFANNGVIVEPSFYTKVIDKNGKVLLEREPSHTELYSPQTAYIMYDLLKGSTGSAALSNMPVAGKTGTAENTENFWFAGVTPYYSASVWIGYAMPTTMTGSSSSAAKLWAKIMAPIHSDLEYKEIERPSGLTSATICCDSGKLATSLCSRDLRGNRVRTELFISGTQPTSYCDVHVTAEINTSNGLLANENTPASLIADRVFILKPNASPYAADYKYVLPTDEDDTKPEETISLSSIGLYNNIDLYDAVVILNNRSIKYTIKGESVSGSVSKGQYTVTAFTSQILESGTVELTVRKITTSTPNPPSDDSDNDDPTNDNPTNDDSNEDSNNESNGSTNESTDSNNESNDNSTEDE